MIAMTWLHHVPRFEPHHFCVERDGQKLKQHKAQRTPAAATASTPSTARRPRRQARLQARRPRHRPLILKLQRFHAKALTNSRRAPSHNAAVSANQTCVGFRSGADVGRRGSNDGRRNVRRALGENPNVLRHASALSARERTQPFNAVAGTKQTISPEFRDLLLTTKDMAEKQTAYTTRLFCTLHALGTKARGQRRRSKRQARVRNRHEVHGAN